VIIGGWHPLREELRFSSAWRSLSSR
jgi:hypothetical protein